MTDTIKPKLHHFATNVPAGASEAFEAWRLAISPELDPLVSVANIESFSLGAVQCSISTVSSSQFERSRSLPRRSPMDSLNISLCIHGSCRITSRDQEIIVAGGDIVLHDMARKISIKADDFTNFSLIFPRHMFEPLLPNLDALHGFVLRKGTPLHALLYSHLIELKAQLPHLTQDQAPMIVSVTAALVAACIGPAGQELADTQPSASVVALSRIRRVIEENLSNPELDPEFLTQTCGVSRASLYRQFEALGGVAKFIQERRLARVYQDLVDPSLAHERINTVSQRWGFTNAAVLTRAFRRQYDIKPSELRSATVKPKASGPQHSKRGFAMLQHWLTTGTRI